jgi:UDP-galactopyranose mutase
MFLKEIGFAGAGFASAVLARELVESGKYKAILFDERSHIAGNCYTSRDSPSGILVHHYGPHIFNTSREDVWNYVNRFSKFGPFINRVKAVTEQGVFSLPINLLTINQFFKKTFNPKQAQDFISSIGDASIGEPKNFEEQALKMIGRELYENFFYGYTKKQWGVEPRELPAAILKRLPVRFNYDDSYFNQKFQGIPLDGYTSIVEKILDHPLIEVRLNEKVHADMKKDFTHLFYSGPLDGFFRHSLGRLRYRTLIFKRFEDEGDFQGNAVINYCQERIPFTRITEHKHFAPWEEHSETVCFREYSKFTEEGDTPYYPMRLAEDKKLLKEYVELAHAEKKISFIGRLGTYRYLDMHIVIGESLDFAKQCLAIESEDNWPRFSVSPI